MLVTAKFLRQFEVGTMPPTEVYAVSAAEHIELAKNRTCQLACHRRGVPPMNFWVQEASRANRVQPELGRQVAYANPEVEGCVPVFRLGFPKSLFVKPIRRPAVPQFAGVARRSRVCRAAFILAPIVSLAATGRLLSELTGCEPLIAPASDLPSRDVATRCARKAWHWALTVTRLVLMSRWQWRRPK